MKNITLIVLAGGEGKRFWPFSTNKALFPFFGLPMFAQTIADLPPEISKMIVVTSPANNDAIRLYRFPIETATVVQQEPTGMADALLACREVIHHDPILIVNADDAFDSSLVSQVCATDAFGAIPGWKPSLHGPFGYIVFEGHKPKGIVEKPGSGNEPSPYIDIVCDYLRDGGEFIDEIAKTKSAKDDVFEKAMTSLMARHEFTFVPYTGTFAPLKYPWHVLEVMKALFEGMESHRGKNVVIQSNVIFEGFVYLEDGVKILHRKKYGYRQ